MKGTLEIRIGYRPCANGETHEFFLADADGKAIFNGVGVFRSVETGDHLPTHAWQAFRQMVLGDHQHEYTDSCHRGSHDSLTSGPRQRKQ